MLFLVVLLVENFAKSWLLQGRHVILGCHLVDIDGTALSRHRETSSLIIMLLAIVVASSEPQHMRKDGIFF